MSANFWAGRRVFVTGHTGFKGAWLCLWLHRLGAEVTGYALPPPTTPSLFEVARVGETLAADHRADILDLELLARAMEDSRPEVVFHMAAQALVREGYRDAVGTYAANVMGTVHVLEAARRLRDLRALLSITTDKCYENREWVHPYREPDRLGGTDPYSASKACAELVTASYRTSFFSDAEAAPLVATVRAGNVIGGGDWAKDRLLPDCMRSFVAGEAVTLRYPSAVRPWQHVLEPLAGYLLLAERMVTSSDRRLAAAWNFGPAPAGEGTVEEVASLAAQAWGGSACVRPEPASSAYKEAGLLRLDSTKARHELGWAPRWTLAPAVEQTTRWYRAWHEGADMRAFTLAQIDAYVEHGA